MVPFKYFVIDHFKWRSNSLISSLFRQLYPTVRFTQSIRTAGNNNKRSSKSLSLLYHPVPIKTDPNDKNIGIELTGALNRSDIIRILNVFESKKSIVDLAMKYGLDNEILRTAMTRFRKYCLELDSLPVDLHVTLNDIIQEAGNVTDIFPYFLRYTKAIYPHIDCLDDLKQISDLRHPPNWYIAARAKSRKIIYHAGPTNSGKTYQALKRFMSAKTGVYCGPLKLLAVEVFNKTNALGTPCDLVTGEERNYAKNEMSPADHVACSVEMVNIENIYEVAVIDEIQLVRDPSRGWAWTRALLGLIADEIHLCGETAAIPIVKSICSTIEEEVEVLEYKRLTDLVVQNKALCSLSNVEPGDCIVCFNKNDIFTVSQAIESMKKQVAVIYGSLPPGTKLAQAARFNDVHDPCNILVATNAIGMGLNLHIRRIIFYSLSQLTLNEKGEKEISTISVSTALQIAGRAGRYKTQWPIGYVTTFKPEDLRLLQKLLNQTPETIKQAGLHPTTEQIELYAYYLPNTPLSNLINIFVALSQVDDSLYFICNMDDFKFFADMIQHIPLPLRMRYVFCCAPVNKNIPFVCGTFLKFARQCSRNEKITVSWLCKQIQWPSKLPRTIADLVHLEAVFDILDIYLWLSYRFMDLFPDRNAIREIQKDLDRMIERGVKKLKILFQKTEADIQAIAYETNTNEVSSKQNDYLKTRLRGKLTNSLISQGRLTPELLHQLELEWTKKNKILKEKNYCSNHFSGENYSAITSKKR